MLRWVRDRLLELINILSHIEWKCERMETKRRILKRKKVKAANCGCSEPNERRRATQQSGCQVCLSPGRHCATHTPSVASLLLTDQLCSKHLSYFYALHAFLTSLQKQKVYNSHSNFIPYKV
jgi:hypothetical protein